MINKNAICESLVCGRVLSFETFDKGRTHNFEKLDFKPSETCSTIDDFQVTFCTEIKKSLKNKGTIALALSGGKDSRTILAFLLENGISPTCVTWSYREDDPEVRVAKKICDKFNLDHKYIKIAPELYFDDESSRILLEMSHGSPLYYDMMLWYGIRGQLNYDTVLCGNLMTEYMDTAEYRLYEGDFRTALFNKETFFDVIDDGAYRLVINKLEGWYHNEEEHKLITNRMLDRIVQYHIMQKFINWNYPVYNKEILSALFALPPELRMGSKLTRKILNKLNPGLYKMPTGRSPFSLRYPLLVHQAYAKVAHRNISKGFEHLLPDYLRVLNDDIKLLPLKYDFIEPSKLDKFFNGAKDRYYRLGMSRLLNLMKWSDMCE